MTEQHFYIENARLMSYGLSNMGTESTIIKILKNEPLEVLAGKLIGLGFHCDRVSSIDTLVEYTKDKISFIRRCAYVGLSFAGFIQRSERISEVLEKGFYDCELEVRKAAIIGFGLTNSNIPNQSLIQALDIPLHDREWKIRSAAGLAYSFISCGNPEHFAKFVDLLKEENSPYVKVCSSWYISNAFAGTKGGLDEYKALLSLNGDENSFFRDMACIGLGFSYFGTSNSQINGLLNAAIRHDKHPYVRESALFGLALCNYQNPDEEIIGKFRKGLTDNSPIVRSGAGLSYGIAAFRTESFNLILENYSDPSVLWGLTLSEGMANVTPSITKFQNNYVQWGYHLSNGFRDNISKCFDTVQNDVSSFQQEINSGFIGSDISETQQKDTLRLIVPGIYHYLIYDSFWWGLWVMCSLGILLNIKQK